MDARQLAKLVRQNAAKAEKLAKARQSKYHDPTLAATQQPAEHEDADMESTKLFKEMKRREF